MEALREEAKQSTAQNVKQLPGRSKRYTVTKRIIDIVLSLIASLVLLIQHGLQCLHVITPHIRAGAFQQPGAESRVHCPPPRRSPHLSFHPKPAIR